MVMTSDVNDYYIAIGTRPFTRRQGFFSEVREAPIIDQDKMDAILSFLLKGSLDDAKAAIANKEAFHFSGTLSSTLDGINRECRYRAILVNTLTGPELTVRVLDRNLLALDQIGLQSSHYEQLVATLQRKGLILVTGPAGAGKSTTLAAMIQCIIDSKQSRVVTLEDPIEFIYKASVRENYTAYSMVSQRTVGVDTATVEAGIKDALRQKPDLIMIGEIRGDETMKAVLQNVETGRLYDWHDARGDRVSSSEPAHALRHGRQRDPADVGEQPALRDCARPAAHSRLHRRGAPSSPLL